MKSNRRFHSILLVLSVLAIVPLACNMPGVATPTQSIQDSAAQTVAAQLTNAAQPSDNTTQEPQPPTQQVVSTTQAPTSQPPSPTPCTNKARYISDVTIPDDTHFNPGDSFIKTWRVQNVGTCTWNSNYSLVFSSGNIMGGSSSVPLIGNVSPNSNVDISVNLTAPSSNGTHQGNWKMRAPDGTVFGFGVTGGDASIFVRIVVGPTPTPGPVTKTFNVSSDGSARSNNTTVNSPVAGDTAGDLGTQAFLTFDISAIPDDATIQEVSLDLGNSPTIKGDPFGDLGCLRVYPDQYGSLGGSDYTPPPVNNTGWRFCSTAQLDDSDDQLGNSIALDALQDALEDDNFQVRAQFNELETDSDSTADNITFGNIKLKVKYIVD
ncbi:MAG: hypothetical protein JXA25_01040 [Anaerolineales bacterium]|nr:hypothetical protein [Anaerolineales bacterium]